MADHKFTDAQHAEHGKTLDRYGFTLDPNCGLCARGIVLAELIGRGMKDLGKRIDRTKANEEHAQRRRETTERTLPGGGIIIDRRTNEERAATVGYVVGTDKILSGWGNAPGRSIFAVPFTNWDQADACERWMNDRRDQKRVRVIAEPYRPQLRDGDHLSIRGCWDGSTPSD